jgi:hypothetical protein
VHYYTTYFIAMAAGYAFDDAGKIARYANLPDEWQPLDSETYSAREHPVIGLMRGTAESPNNLPGSHGSRIVNEGIHAFDSGQSGTHTAQREREVRQGIVTSTALDLEKSLGAGGKGDEKTFAQLGFAVHALGDAYAHTDTRNESERYGHVWGHGGAGVEAGIGVLIGIGSAFALIGAAVAIANPLIGLAVGVIGGLLGLAAGIEVAKDQVPAPDNPARQPGLYGQYVKSLQKAFQEGTGRESSISKEELDDFIRKVTSEENEKVQANIIRKEFKERFQYEMPGYKPESTDKAGPKLSDIPDVTRDPKVLRGAAQSNFLRYQEAIR